jgi:membrane-associated phospholipid phosphatase
MGWMIRSRNLKISRIEHYLESCKSLRWKAVFLSLAFFLSVNTVAQNPAYKPLNLTDSVYLFSAKKLIAPAVMVGYGFTGLFIQPVRDLNVNIRDEITSRVSSPLKIDNFTWMAPSVLVYGLNLAGVRGKHDFFDRSVILATSVILVEGSVQSIKYLGLVERPDGSNFYSFPSSHTAIAFAGAEFLFQEYKDVSAWYGVAGYTVAAGTGFLRMYNNRHWLTDVVAGAGIGIISTKMAYWLFPKIKKLLFRDMIVSFSFVPSLDFQYGSVK